MTESEYIRNMKYLINKYIPDENQREKLLNDLKQHGSEGAKGILHDFNESSGEIELSDSKVIKDISFYFI